MVPRRITIVLMVLLIGLALFAIRLRHELETASDVFPWDEAALRTKLTDHLPMAENDYRIWLEQLGFTVSDAARHAARHIPRGFPCQVDVFVTWTPEGDQVRSVDILSLPASL